MKVNKLLATRIIVSFHAWKGLAVILKPTQFQLTNDILLQRNYENHLLICLEEDDADKALIELLDEPVGRHFGKENTPNKVLRVGNLWPLLSKDTQAYGTRCQVFQMSTSTEKEDAFPL